MKRKIIITLFFIFTFQIGSSYGESPQKINGKSFKIKKYQKPKEEKQADEKKTLKVISLTPENDAVNGINNDLKELEKMQKISEEMRYMNKYGEDFRNSPPPAIPTFTYPPYPSPAQVPSRKY